jgi:hypothetical protein
MHRRLHDPHGLIVPFQARSPSRPKAPSRSSFTIHVSGGVHFKHIFWQLVIILMSDWKPWSCDMTIFRFVTSAVRNCLIKINEVMYLVRDRREPSTRGAGFWRVISLCTCQMRHKSIRVAARWNSVRTCLALEYGDNPQKTPSPHLF